MLGRVVASIAAASHFSLAKIADLRRANAALAAYVEAAAGGAIDVTIASGTRRLSLTAGPVSTPDDASRASLDAAVDHLSAEGDRLSIELLDASREATG